MLKEIKKTLKDYKSNHMFRSARIKLTAWYLVIIMAVTLMFSSAVYFGVLVNTQRALDMHELRVDTRLREFGGRYQNMPPRFQEPINLETIEEVRERTLVMLAGVNFGVLVISAVLGYFLAGHTLRPIERMTEKQKRFVADAAHELKTPLTAMKTNLEVNMRNKKLKLSDAKKIMGETVEDVDSLTYLTESLIKQSRYDGGDIKLSTEKFKLTEISDKVIKKLEKKIQEKKIELTTDIEDIELNADKPGITELLTILMDNAVKFNKENGEIKLAAKAGSGNVYIKIEDSGHGIEKKDLPYIFDRFYKSDISRTKQGHDGFGLGLSIAKQIVQRHKGKIEIQKTDKTGTVIVVTLPHSV